MKESFAAHYSILGSLVNECFEDFQSLCLQFYFFSDKYVRCENVGENCVRALKALVRMRRVFGCYLSVSHLSLALLVLPTLNGREGGGVSGQIILTEETLPGPAPLTR